MNITQSVRRVFRESRRTGTSPRAVAIEIAQSIIAKRAAHRSRKARSMLQ